MKKRLISIIPICFLVPFLSCSNKNNSSINRNIKLCIISDYRDISEKSMQKEVYDACVSWCDANNITYTLKKPNGDTNDNRRIALKNMLQEGYNHFILLGNFASGLHTYSEVYPSVKFMTFDTSKDDMMRDYYGDSYDGNEFNKSYNYTLPNNVTLIDYEVEKISYIIGYSLIKEGYSNVGFVGTFKLPHTKRYGYGFINGVNDASTALNKEVTLRYGYSNDRKGTTNFKDRMNTWMGLGLEGIYCVGNELYKNVLGCASNQGIETKVVLSGNDLLDETLEQYRNKILSYSYNEYNSYLNGLFSDFVFNKDSSGIIKKGLDNIMLNKAKWKYTNFTTSDYDELVKKINNNQIVINNRLDVLPTINNLVTFYNEDII